MIRCSVRKAAKLMALIVNFTRMWCAISFNVVISPPIIVLDCDRLTYNLYRLQFCANLIPTMAPMTKPTSANSKGELLPSATPAALTGSAGRKQSTKWKYLACTTLGFLALLRASNHVDVLSLDPLSSRLHPAAALCPQEGALYPVKEQAVFQKLAEIYGTQEFKTRAINWVSSFAS